VQVDPIKLTLKSPGYQRLKVNYDEALSNCAFNFNWRRYIQASFKSEPNLSFGTVNISALMGWSEFAAKIGGGPNTLVLWHASRAKYQKVGNGDGNTTHAVLCSRMEKILDGMGTWEECDWP